MKSLFFLLLLIYVHAGPVYNKGNVPAGELPPPLENPFLDFNIIQIGGGSAGDYSATLLAQTGCLKILVLDDGGAINWNEERFLPGFENEAYFQTDVEFSAFPKFDFLGGYTALGSMKQIVWNTVYGGAMRLSHFAVEAGSSKVAHREMYEALGNASEWDPNYLWGYFNDHAFNYVGPNASASHLNLGKLRAVDSKPSAWQSAWYQSCQELGYPLVGDFNTINGSLSPACGAEPSNIRADYTRSATENEYLEPELATNPNIVLVQDAKVTKILFDYDNDGIPNAVGVQGFFNGQFFSVRLRGASSNPYIQPGNCQDILTKYRQVILSAGTVWNTHILMHSGIGPRSVIEAQGLRVVKENNHVGRHLKEASSCHSLYQINATREEIGYYNASPSPFVQSRPALFVNLNGSEMFLLGTPLDFGFSRVLFAISFELEQEKEGSINITTPDPSHPPLLYYGWDTNTLQKHVPVLKLYRQMIYNTSLGSRFNAVELEPGLSTQSDADWRTFAKKYLQPVNHLCCTTRMALNENDGVVGRDFKVFGVRKLRLGSVSVLRFAAGAGGQWWSMALAWNLANSVRSELGLPSL